MSNLLTNSFAYPVLYWTSIVLSVIGFLIFLIVGQATKSFTQKIPKIIFFISLSSVVYSLAFTLIPYLQTNSCVLVNAIEEFALVSTLFWSCCFAHAIKTILEIEDVAQLDQYMTYYYLLGVLIPLPFTFASTAHDLVISTHYLENRLCYQALPLSRTDFKYPVLVLGPFILAIFYGLYCFVKATRALQLLYQKIGQKGQIHSVIIYPMIVALCWMPLTVTNIIYLLGGIELGDWNYWMELLMRVQAFFIGIIYVASTNDLKCASDNEEWEEMRESISKKPLFTDRWHDAKNSFQKSRDNLETNPQNSFHKLSYEFFSPLSFN